MSFNLCDAQGNKEINELGVAKIISYLKSLDKEQKFRNANRVLSTIMGHTLSKTEATKYCLSMLKALNPEKFKG